MARLIYPKKEDNRQIHRLSPEPSSQEAGQILHLKRLLVTVKQHYEKSLHQLRIQLQDEQNQHIITQKKLEKIQLQLTESQQFHEEELHALRQQQSTLKEMLKKAQEELIQLRNPLQNDAHQGNPSEQVEIVSLQEQIAKARLETEQLREELKGAQKQAEGLAQELLDNQENAQKEMDHLRQIIEDQKLQGDELETVVSTTSSHYLRRELEMIKQTLMEGAKETKALETRYIHLLNEKIALDHLYKQLQQQLEHQSSNLNAFQEQLHDLREGKKSIEIALQSKEAEWIESCQERQELQMRIQHLQIVAKEKDVLQDKYEELKDEWKQMGDRLEEIVEARMQADEHLNQLEAIAANQETQLQELAERLQIVHQEKGALELERDQLKVLLDENEARLKVAQQHLAKKVKEVAQLNEKVEEQQINLTDCIQTIEDQKNQLAQLQASIDLYERQEKRLQEQLHEALKGNENQIIKWEEKYFRMYDKWQDSENRIRELKKFEEKHLQMQHLLANLGNFMGGTLNAHHPSFSASQEIEEKLKPSFSFDNPLIEEKSIPERPQMEEKYNLFGMRQPPHID